MPRPRLSAPVMDRADDDAVPAYSRSEVAAELTAEFERMHPAPGDPIAKKRHLTYMKIGTQCPRIPCSASAHNIRRGEIVIGIGTAGPFGHQQQDEQLRALHGESLEAEYGQYEQNNMAEGNEIVGLNWAAYDPEYPWGSFTELFKMGGLHEMPITQFFQCGFHRDPKLAKYRWEEIENLRLYTCEVCHPDEHKEFLEQSHMDNHNKAKHKELIAAKANAKETALASSQVIGKMLLDHQMGNSGDTNSQIIRELLETQSKMAAQIAELQNQKGT